MVSNHRRFLTQVGLHIYLIYNREIELNENYVLSVLVFCHYSRIKMLTKIAFLLVVVYFPIAPAPEVMPGEVLVQGGPGIIPGGGTPGGIGPCEPISPLQSQVAKAALNQIGPGYTLRRILGVRSQVLRLFFSNRQQ